MKTAGWWGLLDDEDCLMTRNAWWWGLLMWWERLGDENGLMVRTTAILGQAWLNTSDINPRVDLKARISPIRTDTNPRVGFELLPERDPTVRLLQIHFNDSMFPSWKFHEHRTCKKTLKKSGKVMWTKTWKEIEPQFGPKMKTLLFKISKS
jgi:hypothetical protein